MWISPRILMNFYLSFPIYSYHLYLKGPYTKKKLFTVHKNDVYCLTNFFLFIFLQKHHFNSRVWKWTQPCFLDWWFLPWWKSMWMFLLSIHMYNVRGTFRQGSKNAKEHNIFQIILNLINSFGADICSWHNFHTVVRTLIHARYGINDCTV